MTVSASHRPNRMSYCYRPVPIRAAFVFCQHTVLYRLQRGRKIWLDRCAFGHPGDGPTCITGLIVTSYLRRMIQIPIALPIILTIVQHPAVSSLRAYPTPAS